MSSALKRDVMLWASVLAGPVFWLCSFQAKFSFVPWACASQNKGILFLPTLIAILLTAGAGVLAWRQWKELGETISEEGNPLARSRFMALGGMVFSAGFALVILAQAVPDAILEACQ